ncbi:hypothetical protein [Pseudomonas syringae]|uniref:hypothetical protein n=1 Tax=Pseudomonas syringae TaxID=317 RepID=UPI00273EA8E3|nr:hypothetical protein [Pseudomonas syringae]MDP5168544.1 hypothetical protein [Pseudomonas syringae pv. aptata str. DSM 50252]
MTTVQERDEAQKLLVIGGPCDGQRMARPGKEFSLVFGTGKIIEKRAKIKYVLRWHPLVKSLVWALPENKSVRHPPQS